MNGTLVTYVHGRVKRPPVTPGLPEIQTFGDEAFESRERDEDATSDTDRREFS